MNITDIRARYPRPRAGPCGNVSGLFYCVGGALCLHIGRSLAYTFPSRTALSEALRESNPDLTLVAAHDFAGLIIRANDAGNFEAAWHHLGYALDWKRLPRAKRKKEPEPVTEPESVPEAVPEGDLVCV
jgi:hypothetical protein